MKTIYDRFFLYQNFDPRVGGSKIINLEDQRFFISDLHDHYFLEFNVWAVQGTYLEKRSPMLFWRNYGYIHQLDNLLYESEVIDYLNEHGLIIYLYEFSMFYNGEKRKPEPPNQIDTNASYLSRIYRNKLHDFIVDNDIDSLRCYDFDSIEQFVKKNKLTNVTVATCHYNVDKVFQHKYSDFKLVANNCCLPGLVRRIEDEYQIKDSVVAFVNKFFIPLFRYSSIRHIIISFALDKNICASWYYRGDFEILKKNLWFNIEEWKNEHPEYYNMIYQGAEKLAEVAPLVLDDINGGKSAELTGVNDHFKFPPGMDGYFITAEMAKFYQSCFCTVVVESIFAHPMSIISEKILIPIRCKRPFLLVGGPHSLEYLKKLGFRTFDQWWDESYDQEEDHEKRLIKILKIIEKLNEKDVIELTTVYNEMKDIILHNYNMLSELKLKDINL